MAPLDLAKKKPLLRTIPFQPAIYSCLRSTPRTCRSAPRNDGGLGSEMSHARGSDVSGRVKTGGEGKFMVLGGLVLCLYGFYF